MYLQVLLLTGHLCDNLIEQTVHNSGVRTLPKVITNVLSKVCNANQHAPHQGGHFLPANLPPHAPGIWVDHDCNDIQSCKCYVCITAHTCMRISQNQYACWLRLTRPRQRERDRRTRCDPMDFPCASTLPNSSIGSTQGEAEQISMPVNAVLADIFDTKLSE